MDKNKISFITGIQKISLGRIILDKEYSKNFKLLDGSEISENTILPTSYDRSDVVIMPYFERNIQKVIFKWDNSQISREESGSLEGSVPYEGTIGTDLYNQAQSKATEFANSYKHWLSDSSYEMLVYKNFSTVYGSSNPAQIVNPNTVVYSDSSYYAIFDVNTVVSK